MLVVDVAPEGYSLSEIGDVLYLDQPVGTGFSFGASASDTLSNLNDASDEFINFMQTFLSMYPEYKKPRNVILMGEGFGGKIVPRFAKALTEYAQKGG
jgi:carboxypeptidase D